MKKNRLFGLLLFLLVTNNMCAQLGKAVREILTGDSVATRTAVRNDSDSVRMADMKKELEEARLSEANMRMEMEQMRLKAFAADSVKLAQQRARIDSLRQFTPAVSSGSVRWRYIVLFVYQAWGIYPFAAGRNDRCGHHAVG